MDSNQIIENCTAIADFYHNAYVIAMQGESQLQVQQRAITLLLSENPELTPVVLYIISKAFDDVENKRDAAVQRLIIKNQCLKDNGVTDNINTQEKLMS